MASVGSLKTLIGELWLLWLVEHEPGGTQWVQPDDQEAKEHVKERFSALVRAYPCVHRYFTGNRHDVTGGSILFQHMWMRFEGASLGNAQRKRVRNQMCSEVHEADKWPPGRLQEFA